MFRRQISDFLKNGIIKGKRILAVNCDGKGELLIRLEPSIGIELTKLDVPDNAASNDPAVNIRLVKTSFLDYKADMVFDYIIFQDYFYLGNDHRQILLKIRTLTGDKSKIFILEKGLHGNGLNLDGLLKENGLELLARGRRFFCPFKLLGLGDLFNAILCRMPLLNRLCYLNFIVFRPLPSRKTQLSASVVIPCYNEEENVKPCIESIPEFGLWREIIVVDDGSKDKTADIVRDMAKQRTDLKLISYFRNRGKGFAVYEGWKNSKGDCLMILDCDMSTPAQELPFFHEEMEKGAEFINGTRLVYPREKDSIKIINRAGVTFFAKWISWLIGKRISDTFCGTKVFLREYLACIHMEEFLWGDWDFFFTAAKYKMKMIELPVHCKARKAGKTKMKPLLHGCILLKASLKGLSI